MSCMVKMRLKEQHLMPGLTDADPCRCPALIQLVHQCGRQEAVVPAAAGAHASAL